MYSSLLSPFSFLNASSEKYLEWAFHHVSSVQVFQFHQHMTRIGMFMKVAAEVTVAPDVDPYDLSW